jgi:multicomponent Na+:H+ antiporter subunit D
MNAFARWLYQRYGPEGVLARTWPTGSMALWAVVTLLAYLLIYYA